MKNEFNRVEVKLFKGNIPLREIEFKRDTADIIIEALKYYMVNAEKIETDMLENGSERLRNAAFYLKRDLREVVDILYGK